MAIIAVEGFDMYNGTSSTATAGGLRSRWSVGLGAVPALVTGRFGGQALNVSDTGSASVFMSTSTTPVDSGCVGFALYINNSMAVSSSGFAIFGPGLASAGTGNTVGSLAQFNLCVSPAFLPVIRRDITTLGTGTTALVPNAWNYIEVVFTISDTVGVVNVYVNDEPTPSLSLTGIDSKARTATGFDGILFGDQNQGGEYILVDDIYVTDTATRLGEQRVATTNVNADASPSDWAASGGAVAPYTMIDEVLCDGDTTYISSSTLNARAMFGVGNLPVSPTSIQAVQVSSFGRKTDTGLRNIQLQYEDASANLYTSSEYTLAGGPAYGRQIDLLQNNPITTAGWTASEVNAMKIGVKVST